MGMEKLMLVSDRLAYPMRKSFPQGLSQIYPRGGGTISMPNNPPYSKHTHYPLALNRDPRQQRVEVLYALSETRLVPMFSFYIF